MAEHQPPPSGLGAQANPRDRILMGAASLLQRTPLHRLKIAAIARESGVSRQTVYSYFEDADDVAASVFISYAEEHLAPPRERILRRKLDLDALEELFWAEIDAARAFFSEGEDDRGVRAEIAEFILSSRRMRDYELAIWLPVLERFADAGVIDPGLDLTEAARWLNYQQTVLVAHPGALDQGPLPREVVRRFVLEPLRAA